MDWTKRKKIKLPDFTAEEVEELLNSVEREDYSSDDSVRDPDFDPNWDEIAPKDDIAISQHLDKCGDTTAALIDAINLSVNLSIDKTTDTPVEQSQPSTSAGWEKPSKRPQSPLPTVEASFC
ncbi:unnamed protein product [Hermetia illucens]|uniref:Uncharacterized protein n=1 Tax=Hermetia illucens TaxID=343691 RepID=A0A7R8UZA1_HERIL|nr:unnamed protein product [Hermetia illucens]